MNEAEYQAKVAAKQNVLANNMNLSWLYDGGKRAEDRIGEQRISEDQRLLRAFGYQTQQATLYASHGGTAPKLPERIGPIRHQLRKHLFLIPIISICSYALERLFFWLDLVAIISVIGGFFVGHEPKIADLKFRDAIKVEAPKSALAAPAPTFDCNGPCGGGGGGASGQVLVSTGTTTQTLTNKTLPAATWSSTQSINCVLSSTSGTVISGGSGCSVPSGSTMVVTYPPSNVTIGTVGTTSGTVITGNTFYTQR